MSDLPNHWATTTVGEINRFSGRAVNPKATPEIEYELYSVPTFPTGSPELVRGSEIGSTKQTVEPNDVLVCKINPRINRVWVVGPRRDRPQIASSEWICVRAPDFDARFLRRYFSSSAFRALIEEGVSGVGGSLTRAQPKRVATFPVPVAPAPEQARIGDKLDVILARIDACRTRLEKVPSILKRFREAVLEAAVSGRLTEEWRELNSSLVDASADVAAIKQRHADAGGHRRGNAAPPTNDVHDLDSSAFPNGWGLVELRELVDPARPITYGILKPGPELAGGVPYVRVADFPNERLNLGTIRRTSPKIDQEFARSRLRPGDLLLSIRGSVGRLIVIPIELENGNITQDSARLAIQTNVEARYVLWFLRSNVAQSRMQRAVKGVAVRGINIGDVRALQVPLPSRHEQREIVRRVDELFALADQLDAKYRAAAVRVEKLTPAVLAKAFRGRLVPQDPSDEPADVLLERLRKGREAWGREKVPSAARLEGARRKFSARRSFGGS